MSIDDIKTFANVLESTFPVIYLDFRSVDRFLYRVRDLEKLKTLPKDLTNRLDQCHIYMICKRPRLSIVPDSIIWNDDSISLKVFCDIKGQTHEAKCSITRPKNLRKVKSFTSNFPHRELVALDQNGTVIANMLIANLAHIIESLPTVAKQLEVLYIGKGLSKNTQDRLKAHETLQKVLAEINSDDPESEVFALVFKFDYRRSAGGTIKGSKDKAENDLKLKRKTYNPSIDERVSLIEAAAISYFQTSRYNHHYINFPNNDTEATRRARKAGADYILVQIDTENIGSVPIYSQKVEAEVTHHIVRCISR